MDEAQILNLVLAAHGARDVEHAHLEHGASPVTATIRWETNLGEIQQGKPQGNKGP